MAKRRVTCASRSLFFITAEVQASLLELCSRHKEENHFCLFNISSFHGLWLNCVFVVQKRCL